LVCRDNSFPSSRGETSRWIDAKELGIVELMRAAAPRTQLCYNFTMSDPLLDPLPGADHREIGGVQLDVGAPAPVVSSA
jgi:hypothetical protein